MSMIITREPVTLILACSHDPAAFYQTRMGLWVYVGYQNRIVSKAKPVEAGTKFVINIDELGEPMTDTQIEPALSKKHLFDESAVCAIVAEMVSKQLSGESGDLLNTGYANLLYTASCVVSVDWVGDSREWDVHAWDRGDGLWGAGYRILSPNN
jgi:hypothetical protein